MFASKTKYRPATKYVGSDPPAELNGDRLSWTVGDLDAGAEKRIVVRVKPTEEGEVRSRATVTFSAAVDAKTKVTRPRIDSRDHRRQRCARQAKSRSSRSR